MADEIEKVRDQIQQSLDCARVFPEERVTETSPCGRYELEINQYATAERPDEVSMCIATVSSTSTGEIVATIKRNDDRAFHCWISRDDHDYLLLAEATITPNWARLRYPTTKFTSFPGT